MLFFVLILLIEKCHWAFLLYSKLRDAFNALDTSNSGEISMADVSAFFLKF